MRIIAHEFQKERNLIRETFGANPLDEGVFDVVDLGVLERRVINQYFHGIGAPIGDASHRHMGQQVRQTPRLGIVVAAGFISQQQTCVFRTRFGRGQAPLGIEQYGAGMRRQDFGDGGLEFRHHLIGNLLRVHSLGGGQ